MQALGKGTISVERLEKEMRQREADKKILQERLETLQLRINEEAVYDFNAEALLQNLRDFRALFGAMAPEEKAESLQTMIKQIQSEPGKLVMEIYELADFKHGSKNHSEWLADMDSNHE